MLYKRATTSLYSDSEGKLPLTSEGLIQFVGLLTRHENMCVWDIFDVPISTTGPTKELLNLYGEINLSEIKNQS